MGRSVAVQVKLYFCRSAPPSAAGAASMMCADKLCVIWRKCSVMVHLMKRMGIYVKDDVPMKNPIDMESAHDKQRKQRNEERWD